MDITFTNILEPLLLVRNIAASERSKINKTKMQLQLFTKKESLGTSYGSIEIRKYVSKSSKIILAEVTGKRVNRVTWKRNMSKQSAFTRSKSTKETQDEAVNQAQSQQYKHQSDITDITLLPSSLIPYLFHNPL